jgi:type I restriction-modification system DNA methylase subunit
MEKTIGHIRDILRKEGITGMSSINHCITFLISRLLDINLCNKVGISPKYSFNNMMKNSENEEVGDQELYDTFYRKTKSCFIRELVNKLKFSNIKFKLKGIHNLKLIMKNLETLDINNLSIKYDLIGTIYEIHLKSGTSNSMRDLGQYYTHRLVIKYMIELCDIKMIDGMIEKIIDPTMGTGGFLTMSIKYLKSKYKNIDWSKNKDNIIGFDIDDNVKNMALLNVFLETGELCTDTLIKQDTLHNDFKFHNSTYLEKAKIILANEPMGLKNITHASCCDRIKNLKIRGTKAEPLFLQLFMEALDTDGRCAVIVPDGVLFNNSNLHKNTRKYLINNFNLKKVIALSDEKFFMNTSVKTSILFFVNDGTQTKNVIFSDLLINKHDDIKEKEIITVNYDTIKNNNYSLFVNKYNIEKLEIYDGIEYYKLGTICSFLPTTKHTSSIGKDKGKYRFYNSSQTNRLYLDTFEVDTESIIIGNGGSICVHYDTNFTPSKHVTVCQVKDKSKINSKYLYYYILQNVKRLVHASAGSTIKWLNKTNIGKMEIPIPSISIQNTIVKQLDTLNSITENMQNLINYNNNLMKKMFTNYLNHNLPDISSDIKTISNQFINNNKTVNTILANYLNISEKKSLNKVKVKKKSNKISKSKVL